MLKGYKYRLYPNKEQEIQIQKHLDAVVLYITKHWRIAKTLMRKTKLL